MKELALVSGVALCACMGSRSPRGRALPPGRHSPGPPESFLTEG